MVQSVNFKNSSGQALYATAKQLKIKDLTKSTPEVFDNEFDGHPIMSLADVIGMIFPNGDVTQKPILYVRHTDMIKGEFRFGNLVELGDDYLSPQKSVYHQSEVAQAGVKISDYHSLKEQSDVFSFGSEIPKTEFRFSEDYYTASEGDFFKIKGELWPTAIFEHESMYNHVSTIIQAATYIGVMDNQKVMGIGEHDRLFIPTETHGFDGITDDFGYFYMNMMGIREDGRKEQALISIENCGKIFAYYYIDGELPIFSDEVTMTADFVHLPYVDDGTCVYKDAVFKFCDKEFHFEGKWGSKGFTPEPRVEKHGQSQIFGTWYEGKTPYKHRLYMTFGENMDCYDYKMKAKGFDVLD
ncbi:MAG: hypothetical protein LKF42_00080 [Streptococcaceae bacterium]|jgi:hypothetical protein|nr:hypothetical protein [Streptococcaceae bacterium]MCH4176129.1 hypothetical protein [Streptococcaceae bacterium]